MTYGFEPLQFDICGALPTGVTVLEASAGTGKTYTIAALAARYVADGIPLERLLLVTFTRVATGELRERVRERLVSAEQGLARALAGVAPREDRVVALLAQGSREEVTLRRGRLARAVASFDSATIATTHGFCQEALGGLGIAGDLEPDVTFVEDLGDLVAEVVDDLYIRRFSHGGAPAFGRAEAVRIARAAIGNPAAAIVASVGDVAQMRARLAHAARAEFDARKRGMAVMTYEDLITRLRSALAGDGGAATAEQLRDRYEVVLVDEFQDTDPAQWEIVRRAFGDTGVTLVLIADPKQAIYAFRGADVYAYLEAAQAADTRATLGVNWRSDQGLIDAHDALLSGVKLGHEGIAYRQVRAAPGHREPRLKAAPEPAPLRIRLALREDPSLSLTRRGFASKPSAREHISRDLAADVVSLLESRAFIEHRREADGTASTVYRGETGGEAWSEPVRPGHLAVLVRTNRQAATIREALDEAGVPAVINGAGSVFVTEPARDWLALLAALERPASIMRAHAAALTPFLGWSAERLAAADDDPWAWEEIHRRLHDWARVLRVRGVASLLEVIAVDGEPPALLERVLSEQDGERRLTDLRHIGQLLHAAASEEQMGTTTLTAWLRSRIAEAEMDTSDEERSRRLESDAEAVQVLTIHRSKGLEFPIVYLPFLWEPGFIPDDPPQPVFFHDPQAGDARFVDVSLEGPEFVRHRDQFVSEQRGEDLRLAYVGLTRARHQAVLWWAGSWDSRNSPLGRLLFSRDEHGDVAPSGTFTPDDAAFAARLGKLAERAPGAISVERATLGIPAAWTPPLPPVATLSASEFSRGLDLRWRRTSYSDITAGTHEEWVGSEPEEPMIGDEPPEATAGGSPEAWGAGSPAHSGLAADDLALDRALPLGSMPVGVDVGTFVHRVLECTDFAAAEIDRELAARIAEVQGRRSVEIGDPAAVAAGLCAALRTPLGPVLDNLALCDFARADRLDELSFELPLAGGERPNGWAELSRIAGVLRDFLPPNDPLTGYVGRLEDAGLRQRVRGYLTGSLDLVVRLPGPEGTRFAVLDYKTNWLGALDAPLTALGYRPSALADEMKRHHYALQALLYLVALHRYLRWRLPGHDAGRDLAGVGYLFLRGMAGPETPVMDGAPCGVFGWRPPRGLVEALSDALDGEGAP
ncbi:MAG: UvrD-helicase domain-containing protein [Solirubrobacteraceae bacterium]